MSIEQLKSDLIADLIAGQDTHDVHAVIDGVNENILAIIRECLRGNTFTAINELNDTIDAVIDSVVDDALTVSPYELNQIYFYDK